VRRVAAARGEAAMIEIILVAQLVRFLARKAKEKGQSQGYAALGVALWFGGEITGIVIGLALDMELAAYGLALAGAATGAAIAWWIVDRLPDLSGGELDIDDIDQTFR
jgi:hypothetical protein